MSDSSTSASRLTDRKGSLASTSTSDARDTLEVIFTPPANPRVMVDGVRFDALTEVGVVEHVLDASAAGIGGLLVTPNLSLLRISHDRQLRHVIEEADIIVCDGMPILWLARLQGDFIPERVTGSSLIYSLTQGAATRGMNVFFIGGLEGAAAAAAQSLSSAYPGLQVVGASCPPFGFEKDPDQLAQLSKLLAETNPHIVFMGLGFPKQELVSRALREAAPHAWFVGCGAAVNFAGGKIRRAPQWMQSSGLEWLHRLLSEPARLAPRYLFDALYGCKLLAELGQRKLALIVRS